jgi:hypothetical protein
MLEGFCFAESSEAENMKYENKISYTPEDGHVGRNM